MESGSGFNEEDYMSTKGKLAFSYSSSSSPSSSSSQQKVRPVITLPDIYEKHRMGSWLGSKYDPEEDNETGTTTTAAAAAKIELMDVTTVADEEGVRREGSGRGGGESSSVVAIEKEHMFDKVVTPSDVGKLNRLVIPKQHAEKYFPLDASTNEKGLLLNFEDSKGKEWRFRYSYWNSSQSYVMTKGWSRFVKEKKLDAGDIVSFQRGLGESGKDRLYIDWRRRPDALPPLDPTSQNHYYHHHHYFSPATWSPLLARQPPAAVPLAPRDHFHLSNLDRNASYGSFGYNSTNYSNVVTANPSGSINFLMRSAAGAPQQQGVGMGMVQWQPPQTMVYESVPVVQGKAAAKRLRLFGVNMDCPIGNESASGNHHHQYDQCDKILSSTSTMPPHVAAMAALQHPQISLQSQFPPHLRLYNGTPVSSSTHQFLYNEKQPAASMSLDLDI